MRQPCQWRKGHFREGFLGQQEEIVAKAMVLRDSRLDLRRIQPGTTGRQSASLHLSLDREGVLTRWHLDEPVGQMRAYVTTTASLPKPDGSQASEKHRFVGACHQKRASILSKIDESYPERDTNAEPHRLSCVRVQLSPVSRVEEPSALGQHVVIDALSWNLSPRDRGGDLWVNSQ